ncbi:hypothetical protein AMTRI_Chr02g219470 [Amborella trichopoda]
MIPKKNFTKTRVNYASQFFLANVLSMSTKFNLSEKSDQLSPKLDFLEESNTFFFVFAPNKKSNQWRPKCSSSLSTLSPLSTHFLSLYPPSLNARSLSPSL